MEATVTMSLKDFDRLRDEYIKVLAKNCTLLNENKEQQDLINRFKGYVIENNICSPVSTEKTLDELLETQSFDDSILKAFWSSSSEIFKKLGISVEDQRNFITRRYNEVPKQEELDNVSE